MTVPMLSKSSTCQEWVNATEADREAFVRITAPQVPYMTETALMYMLNGDCAFSVQAQAIPAPPGDSLDMTVGDVVSIAEKNPNAPS